MRCIYSVHSAHKYIASMCSNTPSVTQGWQLGHTQHKGHLGSAADAEVKPTAAFLWGRCRAVLPGKCVTLLSTPDPSLLQQAGGGQAQYCVLI